MARTREALAAELRDLEDRRDAIERDIDAVESEMAKLPFADLDPGLADLLERFTESHAALLKAARHVWTRWRVAGDARMKCVKSALDVVQWVQRTGFMAESLCDRADIEVIRRDGDELIALALDVAKSPNVRKAA